MNDFNNSLGVLELLTQALTLPRTLDEGLDQITKMTCRLMETSQAVFLFRDEERKDFLIRSVQGVQVPVGSYLQLPERLKRILWHLKNQHTINGIDTEIDGFFFPIIVTPITVKGVRVGLLVTGGTDDPSPRPFDTVRQKLFALIAPFASLIIENAKMNDLLRQRFSLKPADIARCTDGNVGDAAESTRQLTVTSVNNPAKVIRMLADSFYNELTRAGFQDGHVAIAASQLLDNIIRH